MKIILQSSVSGSTSGCYPERPCSNRGIAAPVKPCFMLTKVRFLPLVLKGRDVELGLHLALNQATLRPSGFDSHHAHKEENI